MLRQSRILLVVFALIAWLIPNPANAERCDARCAAYVRAEVNLWKQAEAVTLYRQWLAAVIAGTPEAQCVSHHESKGSYVAENSRSTASGKYQFLIGTSNNVARAMGYTWLIGIPASRWAPWDQDLAFGWAWAHLGSSPWNGTGCN